MPETVARLRYYPVAPAKVRQVLRLIVGRDAYDAREILRFCERGPADEVMKLLDSAIANAGHNDLVPDDELFVLRAFADEGPTAKRWRPRARGRGTRVRKRTSHVTIVVSRYDDAELERRRRREAAGSAPTRVARRRRVAASRRQAEAEHDHDHEHEHEHEDLEPDDELAADGRTEVHEAGTDEAEPAAAANGGPDAEEGTEA
jgi:large subunit ribosomal protein L22